MLFALISLRMRMGFTSRFLHVLAIALTCVQFAHCRLTDDSAKPDIFPTDGSSKVPVNAVIEIQYPKELGATEKDMKRELFSVQQCELSTFSYLDPTRRKSPTATTQNNTASNNSTSGSQQKDANGNPIPDTSNDVGAESTKKIGSPLNFYPRVVTDKSTGMVFNYLVMDPGSESTPLKPKATYCVTAREIKLANGMKIGQKDISFTTEDSPSVTFDNQFDESFPSTTVVPTKKDADNKFAQRDYVLLYLDGHPKKPADLRSHVRLCKIISNEAAKTQGQYYSTDDCNGVNGVFVDSDIDILEPLETVDGHTLARYNLYAITTHTEEMKAGDRFRLILNYDMGTNQDTQTGEKEYDFDVVDQDFYGWQKAYGEMTDVSTGRKIATNTQQMFYVGPGSKSASAASTTTPTPAASTNTSLSSANTGTTQTTPPPGGIQPAK